MGHSALYLCMVTTLLFIAGPTATLAATAQGVIIIGWEGAQRGHVNECLGRNELPNLKKLIDKGTLVEIDVEGATGTTAGWAQILTGYYPETTGIYSDSMYQPIPEGMSVFERMEKKFKPDEFATVAVIGTAAGFGTTGPKKLKIQAKTGQQASRPAESKGSAKEADKGVSYRLIPGQPYHHTQRVVDVFESDIKKNKEVATRVIGLLKKYRDEPFLFFILFAEADRAGHEYGENSKQYNDALISNDRWTGEILNEAGKLGLAGKTQVYVTAAHGFCEDSKEHSFAPYVFLATNNKRVIRGGRRQDIAPTILETFGLDSAGIKPPLDGISLARKDNRPPARLGQLTDHLNVKRRKGRGVKPDVAYVTTPQDIVDKMLELAQVTKDDLIYDLGCGDGRIVVTAAKRYGCRGVGYDIDPACVTRSRKNVEKNAVGELVQIENKDIFKLDLSKADVIMLYLNLDLNTMLIPQLEKLRPGSRIVSHDVDIQGLIPEKTLKIVSTEDNQVHLIYLWTAPLKRSNAL